MFSKLTVRLINKTMFVCLQTGYEIIVSVLFNVQMLSNLASSSAMRPRQLGLCSFEEDLVFCVQYASDWTVKACRRAVGCLRLRPCFISNDYIDCANELFTYHLRVHCLTLHEAGVVFLRSVLASEHLSAGFTHHPCCSA